VAACWATSKSAQNDGMAPDRRQALLAIEGSLRLRNSYFLVGRTSRYGKSSV